MKCYYELMENIFKLTREQQGLSLSKLASLSHVSKSTIIRTEQGLYPLPSPKLISALNLKYETTISAYLAFQATTRFASGPHGRPPFFSPDDFLIFGSALNVTMHPLIQMLKGRSLLDFCKAFCIKPDLVTKWVNKPHLVITTPGPVIEALLIAGFPETKVIQISHAYRRYREYYVERQRTNTRGVA